MDTDEIKALLEKYQQGACTHAETQLIEEWLSTLKSEQADHFDDAFIEANLLSTKDRIDGLIGGELVIGKRRNFCWLAGLYLAKP